MRVLLINPNIDPEKVYSKKFKKMGAKLPPLGLCYLAAVLEQDGHAVSIIDANCEGLFTQRILERIDLFEPDIIGLTAVTLVIEECERLAEQIKAVLPHVPVAVGGGHISLDMERIPFYVNISTLALSEKANMLFWSW